MKKIIKTAPRPSETTPRQFSVDLLYLVSTEVFATSEEEAREKVMHVKAKPEDWEFRLIKEVTDYERYEYGDPLDYDHYYIDDKEVSEDKFREFLGKNHFASDELYKSIRLNNVWHASTYTHWVDKESYYFDSIYGDTRHWDKEGDNDE